MEAALGISMEAALWVSMKTALILLEAELLRSR
jgi:hypothetical protein